MSQTTEKSLVNLDNNFLLRMCTGKASTSEIEELIKTQEIDFDPTDLLNMLTVSFNAGLKMAEKIETVLSEQKDVLDNIYEEINNNEIAYDNETLLSKLNQIEKNLNILKEESD